MPLGTNTIYLVLLMLAVGYIYLFFYNLEFALRLTHNIFRVLFSILTLLGKAIYNIVTWIVGLFTRRR